MTVPVHLLRPGCPGAPHLVLAHGMEDGWASWRPLADRLDPDWRISVLDLPWRSGNDYRWRQYDSPAGWLSAGLDALDEPADALVAHSFGATAALNLMAAGDNRIGGAAVLICPLYRPPDATVTWQMLDHARHSFEAHIRDGVRARLGRRLSTLEPAVLDTMMGKTIDRVGPTGLLTVFESFVASGDIALEDVKQRTMVLAGAADPTLAAGAARLLAARIPSATLRMNQDFDHFCHIRRPDGVAEQVHAFLAVHLSGVPAAALEGGAR
jgi:pimeloyl-ACP methyl ester carboxylesterase